VWEKHSVWEALAKRNLKAIVFAFEMLKDCLVLYYVLSSTTEWTWSLFFIYSCFICGPIFLLLCLVHCRIFERTGNLSKEKVSPLGKYNGIFILMSLNIWANSGLGIDQFHMRSEYYAAIFVQNVREAQRIMQGRYCVACSADREYHKGYWQIKCNS